MYVWNSVHLHLSLSSSDVDAAPYSNRCPLSLDGLGSLFRLRVCLLARLLLRAELRAFWIGEWNVDNSHVRRTRRLYRLEENPSNSQLSLILKWISSQSFSCRTPISFFFNCCLCPVRELSLFSESHQGMMDQHGFIQYWANLKY